MKLKHIIYIINRKAAENGYPKPNGEVEEHIKGSTKDGHKQGTKEEEVGSKVEGHKEFKMVNRKALQMDNGIKVSRQPLVHLTEKIFAIY